VTFYGVRGSTPCSSEANRRYGGNTACVALEVPGEDPIVLDLGTGLRYWGETQPVDGTFSATALVTHIHWDHVQGLPFLVPVDRPGATLDIYGPTQVGETLEHAFNELMRPPYFPVRAADLRGTIRFHDVDDGDMAIGDAKVQVRPSRTADRPTGTGSTATASPWRTSPTTRRPPTAAWTWPSRCSSCATGSTS
jgi:phosphoribosyl 1,2-cyclic phosphodiesterase